MKQGLVALLLTVGITVSFGFHAPPPRLPRLPTSLEMGLGSFVKKRFGGKKDDDGKESRSQGASPPPRRPAPPKQQRRPPPPQGQRPRAPAQAPRANVPPPPPSRKQVQQQQQQRIPNDTGRPRTGPETSQDRINRVKSGKMTEEEKQNFLASTLRSSLQGSRASPNPSGGGTPLRQELPNEHAGTEYRNGPSATPFPKDSMLREVVTGRKSSPSLDMLTDSNRKKKEYVEMVTNPNRFDRFNSKPKADTSTPVEDYTSSSRTVVPPAGAVPDSPLPSAANDDTDSDLASRLEAGAYAEEQRQRELRRQVEEQREQDRLRQIELQRQREEELAMREAEALRKKREAMERAKEEEERKRQEEKEKQEQMMAAQQEYWKKKLEAERQRKLQKLSEEDRLAAEAQAAEEERLAAENRLAEQMEQFNDVPQQNFVPEAPPEPVAAPLNSPLPGTDEYTATSFLDEQEQRKAEVEAQREEQLAKLKALNSPLPRGPPDVGLRPEIPVNYASPPAPADIQAPPESYAPPAPAPPGPSMSVLDLMKQKNARDAAAKSAAPAPQQSGGGGFLGRMFGGDEAAEEEQDEYVPPPPPRPAPPAPPPQERRVVRQALPLEDDEDDFDTFSRTGPNKNMSIKDAMQSQGEEMDTGADQDQRSKMWGVDMSRFND